jgi:hypothetical protein
VVKIFFLSKNKKNFKKIHIFKGKNGGRVNIGMSYGIFLKKKKKIFFLISKKESGRRVMSNKK